MRKGVTVSKIAATYIGTIVGAGFATGQEVLQFFLSFGYLGIIGLAIATALFIYFGFIIMNLGKKLDARSHLKIIKHSGGKYIGGAIDIIITFFLFGALTSMIAGTGALFEQQFNISSYVGNIIMAIVTAITVLTGLKGVINSISFVVPFLLIAVFSIAIYTLFKTPPNFNIDPAELSESVLIGNWFMAAILYVSYNTVLSVAVLGPLGVKAQDKKSLKVGALLGGLGLGFGSLMIYLALSGNYIEILDLEVPMIYVAGAISSVIQIGFAIVLIAEIYTTAVGALYGFVSRIIDTDKDKKKGKWLILGTTAVSLLASQFGFSNLVKYLYPIVGYGGLILLISLVILQFRKKSVIDK